MKLLNKIATFALCLGICIVCLGIGYTTGLRDKKIECIDEEVFAFRINESEASMAMVNEMIDIIRSHNGEVLGIVYKSEHGTTKIRLEDE